MEKNKNIDMEKINNEYRAKGVSESVINFATNNRDLLLKLSDDNFDGTKNDASNEE